MDTDAKIHHLKVYSI